MYSWWVFTHEYIHVTITQIKTQNIACAPRGSLWLLPSQHHPSTPAPPRGTTISDFYPYRLGRCSFEIYTKSYGMCSLVSGCFPLGKGSCKNKMKQSISKDLGWYLASCRHSMNIQGDGVVWIRKTWLRNQLHVLPALWYSEPQFFHLSKGIIIATSQGCHSH